MEADDDAVALDCDSEELDLLEHAAELDDLADEEIERVIQDAEALFPPSKVDALLDELRRDGLVSFMQRHVLQMSQAHLKAFLVTLDVLLPQHVREATEIPSSLLTRLVKITLTRYLRQRDKLHQYNTVDDAIELIRKASKILCLGGAGMSTSCGIPDFRSPDGIYAQLEREGKYNLSEPQDMFDKDFFLHDPTCFYSFAHKIFPSNFVPSPSHRFIKLLQDDDRLLRHYTQNIDTLEDVAGIERVLHCHGSFSEAACTLPSCGYKVDGSAIKDDIFAQRVPECPQCTASLEAKRRARSIKKKAYRSPNSSEEEGESDSLPGLSVLKPCITFFGEKVTSEFDRCLLEDREQVDLLIVIGTSLRVAPVSELVGHIPHTTPVILINKTPVLHMAMDIQLLGDADTIVKYICQKLNWSLPAPEPFKSVVGEVSVAREAAEEGALSVQEQDSVDEPVRVADRYVETAIE